MGMKLRNEKAAFIGVCIITAICFPPSKIYAEDAQASSSYVAEKVSREEIDNATKEMDEMSKANELAGKGFSDLEEDEATPTNAKDWRNDYTLEEAYMIAAVVYAEAGHCDDEHQRGVASVILNRMEEDDFPSTVEGVIYQKDPVQYACVYNGSFDEALKAYETDEWESDDFDRAWENTEGILTEGSALPSTVVFQAEFKQGSKLYKKLGNTYFCYR